MRRLLISLLIIALAAMCVAGGVFAFFSDVETSPGNVFQGGTLDLVATGTVTVKLHPDWAEDGTHPQQPSLPSGQRAKLPQSDDDRYVTVGTWDASYSESKYLDFWFPDIPDYAGVTGVKVTVEWACRELATGARLMVFDGSDWSDPQELTLPSPLPEGGWSDDCTQTVDFYPFIDSATEVNALTVRFQATASDGKPQDKKTRHDLVELEVTYTVTSPDPLVTLAEMKPSEPQSAIITVSNTGTIDGVASIHLKNLSGDNEGTKTEPELTDEDSAGPYVPEVVAAGDIDSPQKWIQVTMEYDDNPVDLSGYESATDDNNFVDLSDIASQTITLGDLLAGGAKEVELTFHLDPYDQTGNVFRSDYCSFDIEFLLQQAT